MIYNVQTKIFNGFNLNRKFFAKRKQKTNIAKQK